MGVSFQRGNVIDKGWSYSMPKKNPPTAGQGGKESKKCPYDVGTRSPTGKSLNPAWVPVSSAACLPDSVQSQNKNL